MAQKSYYLRFGSGNPSSYSGLSPTFIVFANASGSTTSPSISEVASTGLYTFDYECTGSVAFVVDGATTGLSSTDRYVAGSLDISDRVLEFLGQPSDAVGFSSAFGQIFSIIGQGNTMATRVGTIADGAGFSTVFGQAIGSYDNSLTLIARVGTTADAIGDNSTEPTTVYGFLKRCENYLEGDSTYTKATGIELRYDKTGATLLVSKTYTDSSGVITKT